MVDFTKSPQQYAHVIAQRVSEDLILLDPNSEQYFTLNDVGGRVWELCDGTRSIAEMVSIIHQEYDAPLETIQADVVELLTDLAAEKLLSENGSLT